MLSPPVFYLWRLFCHGHSEFLTFIDTRSPALHDGLVAGMKLDGLFSISMAIRKQKPLLATKGRSCHWHRNRDIDAQSGAGCCHCRIDFGCRRQSDLTNYLARYGVKRILLASPNSYRSNNISFENHDFSFE